MENFPNVGNPVTIPVGGGGGVDLYALCGEIQILDAGGSGMGDDGKFNRTAATLGDNAIDE